MIRKEAPEFLDHGEARLAYHHTEGAGTGVIFFSGFKSDMMGSKALALEAWARAVGRPFTRFDYQGHGQSSGRFQDGTLGDWIGDALAILDRVTAGPQILVGSSMGAWVMLHTALRRPDKVAGLVGLAAAPDFTEELIWEKLTEKQREKLVLRGYIDQSSDYEEDPYPITLRLIEEARLHLLLRSSIALRCRTRLIHGMADADVPWQTSTRLASALMAQDVKVTLIKDGGHRLSREEDISQIVAVISEIVCDNDR